MTRLFLAVLWLAATVPSQPPDATRQPDLRYVGSDGCDDLSLYAWNDTQTEVLVAVFPAPELKLDVGTYTFDLASAPSGVTIRIDSFTKYGGPLPYCTDYVLPGQERHPKSYWKASAGRAVLKIGPRGSAPKRGLRAYRATLRLENLVFIDDVGTEVRHPDPVTLTGIVGWTQG